ncbi:integrase [Pseudomonadota bacterium]
MATFIERKGRVQAVIRRAGYPTQSKTHDTKSEAEIWARGIEADMDRGLFVDRSLAERETLKDVIDHYLKHETPKHKGEQAEKLRLEKFKRDEHKLCAHAMANLRTVQFEKYRDKRLNGDEKTGKGKVKPGTVKRELNLMHSVIEFSRRRLALLENPLSNVKRPHVRDERIRRFQPGEEQRLMDALDQCRNEFIKSAVIVALDTSMRRGELLSLKWDDVDFAEEEAKLHDTKNGEHRDVPLPEAALTELIKLKKKRDESKVTTMDRRVFPISAESLKNAFERARARANMKDFNFHDLRHEAISRLFEAGFDQQLVKEYSGHKDMQSLSRYVNLKAGDLARMINKANKRL